MSKNDPGVPHQLDYDINQGLQAPAYDGWEDPRTAKVRHEHKTRNSDRLRDAKKKRKQDGDNQGGRRRRFGTWLPYSIDLADDAR